MQMNISGVSTINSGANAPISNHQLSTDEILRELVSKLQDRHIPAWKEVYQKTDISSVEEIKSFTLKAVLEALKKRHIANLEKILVDEEENSSDDEKANENQEENSPSSSDKTQESPSEGMKELEDRVAELERWRSEEVEPFMGQALSLNQQYTLTLPGNEDPVKFEDDSIFAIALSSKQKSTSGFIKPEEFDDVLHIVKKGLPTLLVGPAGCGKTTMGQMIAEELNAPFGMVSCSGGMTSMDLIGSLMPTGAGGNFQFTESKFTRMCQRPGVFLLDEVDAADENLLLVLNSALAQREFHIPTLSVETLPTYRQRQLFEDAGKAYQKEIRSVRELHAVLGEDLFQTLENTISTIKLHPEFRIIAAANTFGKGADRQYVGRNQLDEASLDRFRAGTVEMGYSKKLEEQILPTWAFYMGVALREILKEAGMRKIVSTRFLVDCVKAGYNLDKSVEVLTQNWSRNEVDKIQNLPERMKSMLAKGF